MDETNEDLQMLIRVICRRYLEIGHWVAKNGGPQQHRLAIMNPRYVLDVHARIVHDHEFRAIARELLGLHKNDHAPNAVLVITSEVLQPMPVL